VFGITPSGHETVLHGFAGSPDGSQPQAALLNVNGTVYGTTADGGANKCNCGTVFSITLGDKEKVLYSFGPYKDGVGWVPAAALVDVKGTLYGTTTKGGDKDCDASNGCGTVFSITPGGKEKLLYSFHGSPTDGAGPWGLVDVSGTFYGTTYYGGAYSNNSCFVGVLTCGTVFSITPSGKEKVLHSFSGPDGANPIATLLNVNGTLYGTTQNGGAYGCGTVFSITLAGYETVLYSFIGSPPSGHDGCTPYSGLSYVNGTFYGTTYYGGAYGYGTVYSITL
jgi:uncharacterized repeat protein (TIGR03803 family)